MSFNVYRYMHVYLYQSQNLYQSPASIPRQILGTCRFRGDLEARKTEQENAELRSTLAQLQANPPRAPLQLGLMVSGVRRDHTLDRGDRGCYVGLLHQLNYMWNYWTCWGLLKELTKWDDPPSRCLGVENLWWTVWWKRGFLPSPSWGFGLVVNFRYGSLGTLK